jgi:dihydrofolate reductase
MRGLVAIDSKRGMADDNGIPWNIPGDQSYFVDKLQTGLVLMGFGTYEEVEKPFGSRDNYVATRRVEPLRGGFIPINDVSKLKSSTSEDIWNIGGPGLLNSTMDLLDEIYITQLEGDFNCTKFLHEYKDKFKLKSESKPIRENGISYVYQVWVKR